MASGILLMVVVSVTSAITAGQQHSYEAQQRIAGSLAAEELIGRLVIADYNTLPAFNGLIESTGAMLDMFGQPMPELYDAIGREVTVITTLTTLTSLGIKIRGRDITVRTFDSSGRTLAEVQTFVPEPAA